MNLLPSTTQAGNSLTRFDAVLQSWETAVAGLRAAEAAFEEIRDWDVEAREAAQKNIAVAQARVSEIQELLDEAQLDLSNSIRQALTTSQGF